MAKQKETSEPQYQATTTVGIDRGDHCEHFEAGAIVTGLSGDQIESLLTRGAIAPVSAGQESVATPAPANEPPATEKK